MMQVELSRHVAWEGLLIGLDAVVTEFNYAVTQMVAQKHIPVFLYSFAWASATSRKETITSVKRLKLINLMAF